MPPPLTRLHQPALVQALRAQASHAGSTRAADERREEAWCAAADGKMNKASAVFDEAFAPPLASAETQAAVLQHLKACGCSVMRAPGWAAAQCAYLCARGFAHAATGGMETALLGAPRVITKWQYASGSIDWVDLGHTLKALQLPPLASMPSRLTVASTLAACSPPMTQIRAFGHIHKKRGLKARPHMP